MKEDTTLQIFFQLSKRFQPFFHRHSRRFSEITDDPLPFEQRAMLPIIRLIFQRDPDRFTQSLSLLPFISSYLSGFIFRLPYTEIDIRGLERLNRRNLLPAKSLGKNN